jgi:hypothetical protein
VLGRSVVYVEWARAERGELGDQINPWGAELFRTLETVDPQTPSEQSAYDKWLDQTSEREAARIVRIHGAVGVIPTPLWVVLLFVAVVIFVYMLFFADRAEGAITQAVLMGSVTAVIVAMLLLIRSWTARSTRASAVSARWRWSELCASWMSSSGSPTAASCCPATPKEPLSRDGDDPARLIEIGAAVLLALGRRDSVE